METIDNSAFSDCESLTDITLPDTLTSLGNAVFYGCADLEEIKIPEKITVIGNAAFSDCYSLKSVELPRVKVISDFAFCACTALEEIKLPATLLTIGESAFADCEALSKVELGNPSTVYGKSSFSGSAFIPTIPEDGYIDVSISMYTISNATARSAPSLEATAVRWPVKGSKLKVVGINVDEGWAQIDFSGEVLYMRTSLLSFDPVE